MKLFLDTSVLLAACASGAGASREIFRRAATNDWILIATPYGLSEVETNLPLLPPIATTQWPQIRSSCK
jgi:predicted nucleic acid-binding protein